MEFLKTFLNNPYATLVIGFIVALIFIASPYEIQFDDKEDIEI
jgi:hypothetical protein